MILILRSSFSQVECNVDSLHHASMPHLLPTQSRVQNSLRITQLARGPQRQHLWQGMPVTFVHGNHKGKNGYIKTAQENYPPHDFGSEFAQQSPHECVSHCAGCNGKSFTAEHTCTQSCGGCKKIRADILKHRKGLTEFVDITLQVEVSGGAIIKASVREVRPSECVIYTLANDISTDRCLAVQYSLQKRGSWRAQVEMSTPS